MPENHSGRESPTPRQTAELDKGQGRSTQLPPASPTWISSRGLNTILVAVLTWEGWWKSREWDVGLGKPGRIRQHNRTGWASCNYACS